MSELDTRKSIHDGQDSSQTCRNANNINLLTLPGAVLSRTARLVRMPGASRSGVVGSALEVDHTPFIVNPSEGVRATNNSSPHPVISINGMNMTDKSIRDMGQSFSDFFGRPTLVIPNHTDGAQIDIRNCILSAFSSKNGFRYEPHAAHNLVHELLGRLNDPFPIEINAYSQGTLITCNVLNELKSYFTQHGRSDLWDSLANRIELRTYGAPVHRWPSELQVKELRHVSDPVSLIGDVISFKKGVIDFLTLPFESGRARTTLLHEPRNPHSIGKYVENGPAFILRDTRGGRKNDFDEQADMLIDSMKRGEFSDQTYGKMISLLHDKATTTNEGPMEANKSILLSRELFLRLSKDPSAAQVLTPQSVKQLAEASQSKLKRLVSKNRIE